MVEFRKEKICRGASNNPFFRRKDQENEKRAESDFGAL